jgi:hypothetical protein
MTDILGKLRFNYRWNSDHTNTKFISRVHGWLDDFSAKRAEKLDNYWMVSGAAPQPPEAVSSSPQALLLKIPSKSHAFVLTFYEILE